MQKEFSRSAAIKLPVLRTPRRMSLLNAPAKTWMDHGDSQAVSLWSVADKGTCLPNMAIFDTMQKNRE